MRSSPLVLLLLMGVQAVLNMGGGRALSTEAANHDVGQQTAADHRAGQQQHQQAAVGDHLSEHRATSAPEHHRNSHHRTRRPHRPPATQTPGTVSVSQSLSPLDLSIPEVDPKIFSKRRFRSSPRVVFSEVPPSHDVPEGKDSVSGGGARGSRVRRRAGTQLMHRGEYSVCDSVSHWVGNRTTATDMKGDEVTVLSKVRIENVEKKQFFYETTCLSPTHRGPGGGGSGTTGAAGGGGGGGGAGANRGGGRAGARGRKQGSRAADSGCRGIDVRYWNSYCTNTHTFVSAMTTFEEKPAWRNIRINVACTCVLTRKSWQGRAGR